MIVKELIELLKQIDGNMLVMVPSEDGGSFTTFDNIGIASLHNENDHVKAVLLTGTYHSEKE